MESLQEVFQVSLLVQGLTWMLTNFLSPLTLLFMLLKMGFWYVQLAQIKLILV